MQALSAQSHSAPGIWAQPNGDAFYDWALRAGTTTNMTPDEIHKMGLEELEILHARMDPILRSIGYTSGSVGERMRALAKDPEYQFSEGDAGRAEILEFIDDKLTEITALMPDAFETLASGKVEVVRIPVEVEAGAPGAYGGTAFC